MIEIYCAYSGTNWKVKSCQDDVEAELFLEYLRDTSIRPDQIILCNCGLDLYEFCRSILYKPLVYIEYEGSLEGAMIQRHYYNRFLPSIKAKAIPF